MTAKKPETTGTTHAAYSVRIVVANATSESTAVARFDNPYDAVDRLRDALTELRDNCATRCEEHCPCHSTCDWCDTAAEVDKALAAISDGITAAPLSDGRSSSWTFVPPEGPVVSYLIR